MKCLTGKLQRISRKSRLVTDRKAYSNSTPRSEGPPKKKKKKPITKSKLSFGDDDEEEENDSTADVAATPRDSSIPRSASRTPADDSSAPSSRRITPNPNAPPPPKAMTKAALKAEAEARDALRKEFLAMQEAVKNTEILIPFIFFDGTNIPAGTVRVKKGDPVWLFLDRCRKVGAELGVGGNSGASKARKDNRREWARVSVDDLMLVKGEIIVPHVCVPLFRMAAYADWYSIMNFIISSPTVYPISQRRVVCCSIIPTNHLRRLQQTILYRARKAAN